MAALLVAAMGARIFYHTWGRLRFDAATLDYYFQFVDPHLLRTDLLRSVLHLHSQPPLFNFLLGVVLKAFPTHYAVAFNVIYVGLGVVLILSMFHLMLRLEIPPWLAATVTGLFAISPITVLYEHWLYSTYPVAALLTLATLLLHRYLTEQRFRDAAGFFALLGVIVLLRGIFHPLWYLLPGIGLLLALPRARRRTLIALALPLPFIVGFMILTYVHFGTLNNGKIYQNFNLAQMTTGRLPRETVKQLIRQKKISSINNRPFYRGQVSDFLAYIDPPRPTGVAVLDQPTKSTGWVNWHNIAYLAISDRYGKDARYVLRHYPKVYLSAVMSNVRGFFLPADQSDPFLASARRGRDTPYKRSRMAPLVRGWDVIFAGQLRYQEWAWVNVIALPASAIFGLALFGRWYFAGKGCKAAALVALFMVCNFLYIAALTIALSSGDHSRYRFKATPLVCVLLTMLVWRLICRWRQPLGNNSSSLRASVVAV